MKTNPFLGLLLLAALITAGCVGTVADRKTGGIPLTKDKIHSRYERSVDQVYNAALEVVRLNGSVVNEVTLNPDTDDIALSIEGRVNKRRVYIRVQSVDDIVTQVDVQVRRGAGTDMTLAYELSKQIAVHLVNE